MLKKIVNNTTYVKGVENSFAVLLLISKIGKEFL